MAKESFNWKSLFIQEDEKNVSKQTSSTHEIKTNSVEKATKFPSQVSLSTSSEGNTALSNPYINEILEVYQKGFDSLNQDNFDFFELYKSVLAVGINNPQSYQMSYMMGKSIKPDLTKEFLLDKAKFYITEIEKVHTKYDSTGNAKKRELVDQQNRENANLTKSISDLEIKIVELQRELEAKKLELNKLDANYAQPIQETQLKIEANNISKGTIIDSIQNVINGINQYL
jgi:hypothetical protein